MKKYGLVIMLALCVIVGGVYATWTYAEGGTAPKDTTSNIGLVAETHESAKGVITLTNNLTFSIDDGGEYVPKLDAAGTLDIKFVADDGADQLTKDAGIEYEYEVFVTSSQYNEIDIFTAVEGAVVVDGGKAFEASIDAADIAARLQIGAFKLDTLEKYNNFNTALQNITITVRISEHKAN